MSGRPDIRTIDAKPRLYRFGATGNPIACCPGEKCEADCIGTAAARPMVSARAGSPPMVAITCCDQIRLAVFRASA